MAWVTPPTFTALAGATAAMFNKLRDDLNVIGSAWTTYTPVVSGTTTNPTMGSSSVVGRYRATGQTVDVEIEITIGAGFSAGSGQWSISLPASMSPLNSGLSTALGLGSTRDVSVPTTHGLLVYNFSSTAVGMVDLSAGGSVGAAIPWTWATGDRISLAVRGMEIL